MSALEATTFATGTDGLPECRPSEIVRLADGDVYDLRITPVAKTLHGRRVRMLGYNGSVPGPTLRVRQGSTVTVRVRNDADYETTVHWHGLRLDNRFDGVPHDTQAPIPVGGEFTYQLRFPDDGLYWYHPHVREDYGLEMGLYGNLLVDPIEAWSPVDREVVATLDDVYLEDGRIGTFLVDRPTHTAMGRFGNEMLTAGSSDLHLDARAGDVVRFYLTNTANTRIMNVTIPGVRGKLVGGDSGRYEREAWVPEVLLAPSERAIVDVLFDEAGEFALLHNTPARSYRLGTVLVQGQSYGRSLRTSFDTLHDNADLAAERARLDDAGDWDRAPDRTLVLDAEMPLLYGDGDGDRGDTSSSAWTCPMHPEVVSAEPGACPRCGMKLVAAPVGHDVELHANHEGGHGETPDGLEWEDLMPEINARTDDTNMHWKLVDAGTGQVNGDIDWTFRVGDRVKIQLVNRPDSDHPMHHPFHIHGAGRFLVLTRGGEREANLVWKDTVLVRAGETVDILFDVTNPGRWMAHCHIAEHNQDGMMFTFTVAD